MDATSRATLSRLHIGTSGYVYAHWKGLFYPPDLPAKAWFTFFAERFDTVEMNNTFYRLPTKEAVHGWLERTPPTFELTVKGSRFLTHMKRLLDRGPGIEKFFEQVDEIRERGRNGPVLWQCPPRMKKDVPRLRGFIKALPKGWTHVFEFRDPEWYADDVWTTLDELGASFCVHDFIRIPVPNPPPGPIYYRRFHGASAKYQGRYDRAQLRRPAAEMVVLASEGRPAYAYFNNDIGGHAVFDALQLRSLVVEALEAHPKWAAPVATLQ